MRERLPSDLRHHIIFWQKDVILQGYPSLPAEAWQMGSLNGSKWGSGPAAEYLPLLMFMQEHPAYDFAWVFEGDVRLIGDDDEKWAATALGLKRPFAQSQFQVWGGSRKLFEAMHRVSRGGAFAYYETFVPTVAVMNNMTIVGLPLDTGIDDRDRETYGCCGFAAEQLYRDWYLEQQSCLPYQLLHPIKLREELWVLLVMSPPWMSSW